MMHAQSQSSFRTSSMTVMDRAARALGLFSLALGVAEMAFPGAIARAIGLENRKSLLRAYGAREIVSGLGAMQPNAIPAMWARVAGDVVDLATIAPALRQQDERRRNAQGALALVAAITLVDLVVAASLMQQNARGAPRDFSDRSGFPKGLAAARGAAPQRTALPGIRAAPHETVESPARPL